VGRRDDRGGGGWSPQRVNDDVDATVGGLLERVGEVVLAVEFDDAVGATIGQSAQPLVCPRGGDDPSGAERCGDLDRGRAHGSGGG
jgi:hypothetical protein